MKQWGFALLCAMVMPLAARAEFYEVESSGPCQPGSPESAWYRYDIWHDGGTPGIWHDDTWWYSYGIDCNGKAWENGTIPPGWSVKGADNLHERLQLRLQDRVAAPPPQVRGRIIVRPPAETPEKDEVPKPGTDLQ